MMGHVESEYKKKQPIRREWRVVNRSVPNATVNEDQTGDTREDTGGFVAPKRTTSRGTSSKEPCPSPTYNSFQALMADS